MNKHEIMLYQTQTQRILATSYNDSLFLVFF